MLFAFVLLLVSVIVIVAEDTGLFISWFKNNGGYCDDITLKEFPVMGRGISPLKHIQDGSEIIRVPNNLVISTSLLGKSSDRVIQHFLKNFESDEEIIAAFLLYEKSKGVASFWKPYLDVLPSYVPNLSQFSESELEELQDSRLEESVKQSQHELRKSYFHFIEKSSTIWPKSSEISLFKYKWAYSVIDSRGLRFKGKIHLVPMSDMFNYKPHAESRQAQSGEFFLKYHKLQNDGSIVVLADRDCVAGEQLFEDYGDNSDTIYLQYHGFVAVGNPFRCVEIVAPSLSDVSDEQRSFLTALQFKQPPRSCVDTTGDLGTSLFVYLASLAFNQQEIGLCLDVINGAKASKLGWKKVYSDCGYEQLTNEIQSRLNQSFVTTSSEDSLSNRVWKVLVRYIRSAVPVAPTTAEEDAELLLSLQRQTSAVNVDVSGTATGAVSSSSTSDPIHLNLAVSYRYHSKRHWQQLLHLYSNTSEECPQISTTTSVDIEAETVVSETIAGNSREDEKFSVFHKWFADGCEMDNVTRDACSAIEVKPIPGYRLGTVAKRNIIPEEIYLKVPVKLIIDAEKAYDNADIGPFLKSLEAKFKRRDEFHELLFFLLQETFITKEKSFFWPYLQLLPTVSELDIPLFWTPEERKDRLSPSHILPDSEEYASRILRFYQSGLRVDLIASFFPKDVLTYENYAWAHAILDSRAIWWNGKRHLVPVLDMVNCGQGGGGERVHSTVLDATGKYAITKAAWAFPSGSQVLEDYGQPNHIYYMYHGFSIPNNTYNCVYLDLGLEPHEESLIDWEQAAFVTQYFGGASGKRFLKRGGAGAVCIKDPLPSKVWLLLALKFNVHSEMQLAGTLGSEFDRGIYQLRQTIQEQLILYEERFSQIERENTSVHKAAYAFLQSEYILLSGVANKLQILERRSDSTSSGVLSLDEDKAESGDTI